MANIRPFQAYRPRKGMESLVAALPYDVFSREEAKEEVKGNPFSFLRIDRAETQFDDSVSTYDDRVYAKAAELLQSQIAAGIFVQDDRPCFYLYEQIMAGRAQTGLVACASIDDYLNNVIKKHENTRADKEVDRIRHVDTCNAQTGPIFLCYRNHAVIDGIAARTMESEPVCDFTSGDRIRNRVWIISDPEDVSAIRKAFAEIDSIYIADGHHRSASAVRVGLKRREENPDYTGEEEFNYFLSVLFPQNQLMIMDYNRVVKTLGSYTAETFLEALSRVYEIGPARKEQARPAAKGEVGLYLEGSWYLMKIREEFKSDDPVEGLDVALLQKYVLLDLLGIEDPKTDQRIAFVGGIRGLDELERRVDRGKAKAAFAMYPTSIQELFDVADAGRLMPPKSTWFEPKLLSGLFIHTLS